MIEGNECPLSYDEAIAVYTTFQKRIPIAGSHCLNCTGQLSIHHLSPPHDSSALRAKLDKALYDHHNVKDDDEDDGFNDEVDDDDDEQSMSSRDRREEARLRQEEYDEVNEEYEDDPRPEGEVERNRIAGHYNRENDDQETLDDAVHIKNADRQREQRRNRQLPVRHQGPVDSSDNGEAEEDRDQVTPLSRLDR